MFYFNNYFKKSIFLILNFVFKFKTYKASIFKYILYIKYLY